MLVGNSVDWSAYAAPGANFGRAAVKAYEAQLYTAVASYTRLVQWTPATPETKQRAADAFSEVVRALEFATATLDELETHAITVPLSLNKPDAKFQIIADFKAAGHPVQVLNGKLYVTVYDKALTVEAKSIEQLASAVEGRLGIAYDRSGLRESAKFLREAWSDCLTQRGLPGTLMPATLASALVRLDMLGAVATIAGTAATA